MRRNSRRRRLVSFSLISIPHHGLVSSAKSIEPLPKICANVTSGSWPVMIIPRGISPRRTVIDETFCKQLEATSLSIMLTNGNQVQLIQWWFVAETAQKRSVVGVDVLDCRGTWSKAPSERSSGSTNIACLRCYLGDCSTDSSIDRAEVNGDLQKERG